MPDAQKGFGDVFTPSAPVDKARLLAPRTRRQPPAEPPGVVAEPAPRVAPLVPAPEAEPTPASEQVAGAPQNKATYLPPELLKRVRALTRDDEMSYTDLLIDALDALDFDEAIKHFRPETGQGSSGIPRRVRQKRGSGSIQIQLRLDKVQERWLAEKIEETGAPSRSAFVSYAFERYLQK